MKPKSTGIAYLLLFAGLGIFPLHQFYLGNTSRAFGYVFTLSWLFVGTIIDLFTLSAQTRKANDSRALRQLASTQQYGTQPRTA